MLNFSIDSLDSVDESLHEFYKETDDGSFTLQVTGAPTDQSGDVVRLKGSLEKERLAHKETKAKLAGLGGITSDEVQELRDKAEDLEYQLGKAGESNDEAIEERALKLAERQTRKLEQKIGELQEANTAHLNAISLHEAAGNQRKIKDAVEAALTDENVPPIVDSAREDILPFAERIMALNDEGQVVSRDGVGFEPGLSFGEVLGDIRDSGRRGHWFKGNKSGGAQSGSGSDLGGENPWKAETRNMTKAQKMVVEDPKRARSMIIAAGENPSKYGLSD
tara:strand:+ start:233 stop:1066 length:834 start_codon:yes stop_codon:yes gene_type:complete